MVPRLCELCRQSYAEVASKSSNKIHQTWGPPFAGVYSWICDLGDLGTRDIRHRFHPLSIANVASDARQARTFQFIVSTDTVK